MIKFVNFFIFISIAASVLFSAGSALPATPKNDSEIKEIKTNLSGVEKRLEKVENDYLRRSDLAAEVKQLKIEIRSLKDTVEKVDKNLKEKIEDKTDFFVGILTTVCVVLGLVGVFGIVGFKLWLNEKINNLDSLKGEDSLRDFEDRITKNFDDKMINMSNMITRYSEFLKEEYSPQPHMIFDSPSTDEIKLSEFDNILTSIKRESDFTQLDWFFKGRSQIAKQNFKYALEIFTKAIDFDPKNSTEEIVGSAYLNRGIAYRRLKKYQKAIDDYNKAIEILGDYSNLYSNRGIAYRCLREYDKALSDHNKAIEIDNKRSRNFLNRGVLLSTMKQYDAALKDYKNAMELDPTSSIAYNNAAEDQLFLMNFAEAEKYLILSLEKSADAGGKVISALLLCIANKLRDIDSGESEKIFYDLLSKQFILSWDFSDMEKWLNQIELSDGKRIYIHNLISKVNHWQPLDLISCESVQ